MLVKIVFAFDKKKQPNMVEESTYKNGKEVRIAASLLFMCRVKVATVIFHVEYRISFVCNTFFIVETKKNITKCKYVVM